MVKVYLMASHGYPLGPELGFGRFSKDCQTLWPHHGQKHKLPRVDSFNPRSRHSEEQWKPISGFPEAIKFVEIESTVRNPVLIDVQDTNPNSTLFNFGIAKQCTRHDEILTFLMSSSNDLVKSIVDLSMISELIGLQSLVVRSSNQNLNPFEYGTEVKHSNMFSNLEFKDQSLLLDIVGDIVLRSKITFNQEGRVLFTGGGTELKDILSVVAEYYLANNSTKWRKQTVLIPYFNCEATAIIQEPSMLLENVKYAPLKSEATAIIQEPSMLLENVKYAPLKSPKKIKLKATPKKKSNKKSLSRDLYERNYFHVCETLLSIIVDKTQNKKTTISSLKKSGPELPYLLTNLSSSIAGTGITVLFSVLCKLANSRVPFCSSKIFNTGIGFGLVWLSWGLNKLRDTVVRISKNSVKMKLKEEMLRELDRRVHDLFFKGVALMAVMVLRLA